MKNRCRPCLTAAVVCTRNKSEFEIKPRFGGAFFIAFTNGIQYNRPLMKSVTFLLFTSMFFLSAVQALQQGENTEKHPYGPPMDIFNGISSQFMEYRSNHFHSGIDLRTFRKTGFPVKAIADGEIVELRMITVGTGRALYLKHRDGNYSFYYHLERFNDPLEKLVKEIQQKRKKRFFGFYELETPISVKKGDTIAFSGESGAGMPHLHMEIRDGRGSVLNPLDWIDIPRQDRNRPRAGRIILNTRGSSLIDGECGAIIFPLTHRGGVYSTESSVITSGGFDPILQVYDLTDCQKISIPEKIDAFIDNRPVYSINFDRFHTDQENQLGMVYDFSRSGTGRFYYNLFSQPRFGMNNADDSLEKVWRDLPNGSHIFRVEIKDADLNRTIIKIPVIKVEIPDISVESFERKGKEKILLRIDAGKTIPGASLRVRLLDRESKPVGETRGMEVPALRRAEVEVSLQQGGVPVWGELLFLLRGKTFHRRTFSLSMKDIVVQEQVESEFRFYRGEMFVTFPGLNYPAHSLRLKVMQGGEERLVVPVEKKSGVFFVFTPRNSSSKIEWRLVYYMDRIPFREIQYRADVLVMKPETAGDFFFNEYKIRFPAGTVNETKILGMAIKTDGLNDPEFPRITKPISLYPLNVPFQQPFSLEYSPESEEPSPARIGFFQFNPGMKRWYPVSTSYAGDGATTKFSAEIKRPGIFALFRDTVPPELEYLSAHRFSKNGSRRLIIKIRDKGMGIDEESIIIRINEQEPDWEYDVDRVRIVLQTGDLLQTGENRLEIEVSDKGGNRTHRVYPISIF